MGVCPELIEANDHDRFCGTLKLNRITHGKRSNPVELSGLTDYFSADGVTVVEWAERAAGLLPKLRVDVHMTIRGRCRDLTMSVPRGCGLSGADLRLAGREPAMAPG